MRKTLFLLLSFLLLSFLPLLASAQNESRRVSITPSLSASAISSDSVISL